MFYRLVIPKTLSDFNEVRLLEWHFSKGDKFEKGDLLLEVETQKAIIEIRAQQAGILRDTYHQEGDWILLDKLATVGLFSDDLDEIEPETHEDLQAIDIDINII